MKLFTKSMRRKVAAPFIAGLLLFFATFGGAIALSAKTVDAVTCDPTSIVYCGLSGSSLSTYINSFKSFYSTGKDSYGHTDLKAIFNWGGFSDSVVNGLNTTNTKIGTIGSDGTVTVSGEKVATVTGVTTRLNSTGRTQILPGVYLRGFSATKDTSEQVLVYSDASGTARAIVMTGCGNVLKFTTIQRSLACVQLTQTPTTKPREYTFTARASASNTSIVGYVFDFGDGQKRTVTTSSTSATTTYTYADDGKSYTAKVSIDGKHQTGVTSSACTVSVQTPMPGVSIDKKVDGVESKQVNVNQNFAYQVVVKNTGSMTLTNVVVRDPAPAGVTLVSADKGTITSNVWTYTIPSLAAGQSAAFNLTAKVTAYKEGSLVNTACVNAPEVNPGNPTATDDCDDATVTVTPPAPVLVPGVNIEKTVNGVESQTVELNKPYTYELVVKNTGEVNLTNVVVTDTPQAGVTLIASVDNLGTVANNTWTYTIPSLAKGESKTFKLSAKVTQQTTSNLKNTACVNAPAVNPNEPTKQDDCDDAYVNVPPEVPKNPAITVEKTVNGKENLTVLVNEAFTYELVVKNTGEVNLTNVVVTDTPQAGVTLIASVDNLGTVANNTWTYTIPSLAKGESKTFKLSAKVTEYVETSVVNTVCVNAPEVNPNEPTKQDACDTASVNVQKPVVPEPPKPVTPEVPQVESVTTETPNILPVTGPGEVILAAVAVMIGSAISYRSFLRFLYGR